jgi:N-acetylneuraminic acid mutarotase
MVRSIPPSAIILFSFQANAQWQPLADVPVDLAFPVVVELQGTIHVMGGGGPGGATDLHLRYTPATDAWDTLAPVPYLAQQPCGAVINGKIHYCGGGYPNSGTPLDEHYVYDPTMDQWTQAADLPFPTVINESAALNGMLYVLTGQPDHEMCEHYDPSTNSWYANNALPDVSFWYSALVGNGNSIYRFGGGGYANAMALTSAYDVQNDAWPGITPLPSPRHAPAATPLGDSLICISGGFDNGFGYFDEVLLYHTNSQEYTTAAPLPGGRSYHSMVTIDNCVYSVGGLGDDPNTGLSLLRNCALLTASVQEISGASPYTITATPSEITVRFTKADASFVDLLDPAGRLVATRPMPKGDATCRFIAETFASGKYVLRIRMGGRVFTESWAVVR